MTAAAGYYRHPTIHGDTLAFVCEDDLWSVSLAGGTARRLTANPGEISFPLFSPDGRRIAFTGRDDGPTEVYLMDAEGGAPRRLTWLGADTQVVGWSRDGEAVIFCSNWRQPFQKLHFVHLHAVDLEGGPPRPLGHGPARAISYPSRGAGVVLGRNSGDPARWKRYRGGTAGTIWIDRKGDGQFEELIRLEGNLASPMWLRRRIWFLSDHEGHGNLYSCTPTGRGLRRHTHHQDFYVRFPSTDGKRIAYHAGADLFCFDPERDEAQKIEIAVHSPRTQRNRRFLPGADYLESFRLHPRGHSFCCVSRGGALTAGLWEGAAVRHGRPSRERHRLAAWLRDGKRIVTVADLGGEECLRLFNADGTGRPKKIGGDLGRIVDLAVAPAGADRVALTNHRQELIVVDLKERTRRRIDRSDYERIDGLGWSADGRWLAYSLPVSRRGCCIRVWDGDSGRKRDVTRGRFRDVRPAFDPEGKYLYFISYRVFDPIYDSLYFDLGFPRGSRPYLVPLRKEVVSPFAPAQRAPRAPHVPPEKGEEKDKKKPPKVRIDFKSIADRVVAFPVPEGRYEKVRGVRGRVLYSYILIEGSLEQHWLQMGEPPAKADLEAYDFELEKTESVYEGLTDFELSADAKVLGLRVGNQLRALPAAIKHDDVSDKAPPGRETGWVDLDRLRVEVAPGEEWRQMYREAWRLQRDHFWTPDMSGVDWKEVHDRYLPLVDRVGTRSEFSDLLWEMQGELGTSHCYEMGGDYRPAPEWHQGFLGADLELDERRGKWRIARIPWGDSWHPDQCSPLSAPGLDIRAGDLLLAVGGESVGRDRSPDQCLVHRAGKAVTLTIRSGAGKTRTVTVCALESEYPLRYRDWVEANRRRVHEESDGKVGYVHIPDMGPPGYAEFHRYFAHEADRDGLVIDVRFNGGGHVSELLLEKLLRKRIGYDKPRWQKPSPYPEDAPMGPMVALTNEYAGSDGDIFSHCFKVYGLGPLIGKRTWGGVIGIWPRQALVDGTWTSQPEYSTWFRDVGWDVENYGTDPDIEVEIRPQDYAAGRDPQLERALAEVAKIIRKQKPKVPDFEDRPDLKPPQLPPVR